MRIVYVYHQKRMECLLPRLCWHIAWLSETTAAATIHSIRWVFSVLWPAYVLSSLYILVAYTILSLLLVVVVVVVVVLPRQPSIHCCSDGVIFLVLYVGRSGRWATNGNVYLCETRSPVLALHLYVILLVFLSMRQKLFLWVAQCDVGLVWFGFGCCVARGYFRISPSGLCPQLSARLSSPPPKSTEYKTQRKKQIYL